MSFGLFWRHSLIRIYKTQNFAIKSTAMSQKHITSFFKPKGCTEVQKESIEKIERKTTNESKVNPLKRTFSQSNDESSDNVKGNESNENGKVDISKIESPEKKLEEKVKTVEISDTNEVKPKVKNRVIELGKMRCTNDDDEKGANYNPAKLDYHPIKDAFWQKGESTPYLALTRTFQLIEEIQGRLRMIEVLSNFFWSVILLTPEDLLPCVYLCTNQLAPAYEGIELGIAEHSLMKIICNTTGRDMEHIKSQTHAIGDLGIVAERSRVTQRVMFRPAPLTVRGVFKSLKEISKLIGQPKSNKVRDIFVACRYSEARFFVRSLLGKLRIGMAEQSLFQALAIALVKISPTSKCYKNEEFQKSTKSSGKLSEATLKKHVEEMSLILRTAYCQCPNYDKIISTLLEHGAGELLERCPLVPGVPIKPMLAEPTKGVHEILERLQGRRITCEWKYDGERAQIHCDSTGAISIYSRNQENNTTKYPDVIARAEQFKREGSEVNSFIVDSEIVAWDVERKQILPFQVLSTRKRKKVDVTEIKVQVCVYAFDLLYLNGRSLVCEPFVERRRLLKENFQEVEGTWKFAHGGDTNDVEEIQKLLDESVKGNCEGLMIKTLETAATYEIARRSRNWLKLKKDYLANVGDSLDLVVIGGYKGKGKRTGNYGGFLLACYDNENEEYQSICKIGTGFSDEDLQTHAEFLKQHIIAEAKSYYCFDNSLEPDDWFEPVQIWEVKCADLSLSPLHKAGIGIVDPERGISLRFPRFIRIRDDKTPEMATSARQVASMYNSQEQIQNQNAAGGGKNVFDESEFY